ncbi:DNA topoisomerase IB [Cryobacterium sp. PH29-G1]|uniref:DNA topoisomerase IB n=1 Tax=Cryobacterium sp. PH29-G1 TaxID=3046211 RepID=UPI0024B99E16|nr:DNA topoisomerase IB [Cryobacterium sp. PH29-G1]MDJ0350018.1 DNA topoisomerase IB [Cryobacterium sp. PH29-G1]
MTRLRRSDPTRPGYTRRRAGSGFSYRDPGGDRVTETDLREQFAALAIPPAWTDVWISPHPRGHIQAIGIDAAGRRQYIYHPVWREQKDRLKFERALQLAASLPRVRSKVTRELRGDGPPRTRALAAAFRMLDLASLRIGSERYADTYGSHGLSTLLCSHVTVRGDVVRLNFPAKSGQQFQGVITDADLATYLRDRLRDRPNEPLLSWVHGDVEGAITAADINDFIKERTGGEFSAKDFRTLRGTIAAAQSLAQALAARVTLAGAEPAASAARAPSAATHSRRADDRAVAEAMRQAAKVLGNTPAIARTSYVDPRVVDLFRAGETIDPAGRVSAETALRALLLGDEA